MESIKEISPIEAAQLIQKKSPHYVILDVREQVERDICLIPESIHIPLGELESRYAELNHQSPLLIYCHHGRRSLMALEFLKTKGFEHIQSIEGGIHAWATVVDPTIKTY